MVAYREPLVERVRDAGQQVAHAAGDVLAAEDDDPLVDDDRQTLRRGDRRDGDLRLAEQRSEQLALFGGHLALELGAEPLLLGRRGVLRAPDVLPLQVRAVDVELAVRRLERGQRSQCRLVERPDVGDVGGADRRRPEHGRAQGKGERGDAAAQRKFSHGWYT